MTAFVPFPKIPRLRREAVITEKIDGTNGCVVIEEVSAVTGTAIPDCALAVLPVADRDARLVVMAQSRKRFVTPGADNAGFAAWVSANAEFLVEALGPGRHFGEWWGRGIQRGYGLDHRRFSLFNAPRYADMLDDYALRSLDHVASLAAARIGVVPWLARGTFTDALVNNEVEHLRRFGSWAAPGYMNPEGVVVYHVAAGQTFKVLLENDEAPKGRAE
jgi:hypothetical protein